jgi:hypothetical protein
MADVLARARLTRDEAVDELGRRLEPGQHVTLIGPTGKGKSTMMSQLLPNIVHDTVVICCPKGADPAYAKLGHATMTWPPKQRWQEQLRGIAGGPRDEQGPRVWRVELPMTKLEDFSRLASIYRAVLQGALARKERGRDSLLILLDDSRLISDSAQMGLASLVTANLMIGRSKRVSIVNNYQAPRWVPREGLDQCSHLLMWRNRDRDVARRLSEVADLDPRLILGVLRGLDDHEALWIDTRADELFIVGQ